MEVRSVIAMVAIRVAIVLSVTGIRNLETVARVAGTINLSSTVVTNAEISAGRPTALSLVAVMEASLMAVSPLRARAVAISRRSLLRLREADLSI